MLLHIQLFDSRNSKTRSTQKSREGITMDKNKGQQRREASTSHIKRNPTLTDASNSIRHSPRKKRNTPQNKPMPSGSANSRSSPKVGRRNATSNELSTVVLERYQSPRKKEVTDVEESVKSNPVRYALPKVGRRTGEAAFAGKKIRINPDGFENFEDYWTDEESIETEPSTRESVANGKNATSNELSKVVPERHQSPRKKQVTDVEESVTSDPVRYALPKVGRRTGEAAFAGKHIRINPDGFENFEDYWTDEESIETEPSTRESVAKGRNATSNELPKVVPERRRSPRKKQVTDIEESVKSYPVRYALPKVGRRTGEDAFAGKHIRINKDGFENFDDYFTDESSNLTLSSLAKSNISESSSNNDGEAEKVMLDKACNTFRNARVNDLSLNSSRNKKDSFEHRQSAKRSLFSNELNFSESPKKRDNEIDENFLNEDRLKNFNDCEKVCKTVNKVPAFDPTHSSISQNEETSHDCSPSISSGMHSPKKILNTSRNAQKLLQDSMSGDENIAPNEIVSPRIKSKSGTHRHSSQSVISQNKEPPQSTSQRFSPKNSSSNKLLRRTSTDQRSKLIEDPESDEEFINTDDGEVVDSASLISNKTAKRSLNFSKQNEKIIEYSSSKGEHTNIETASSRTKSKDTTFGLQDSPANVISPNKELVSNKSRHVSPRSFSLKKNLNTSRSSRNESKVTEDLESEVAFDKEQEKKSSSFRSESGKSASKGRKISKSKNTSSFKSSKHKSKLVEDSDSEENSGSIPVNEAPSTSIRSTNDISSRSLPKKSHSTSRSTRKATEDLESDGEFDKEQGKKSVSFRNGSRKSANDGRKISQSRNTSSSKPSKHKSKLVEDSDSEDDSSSIPFNEVLSTSIRNTNHISSRSSPKKSRSTTRSNRNNSKITGDLESEVEFEKIQENKLVSFRNESDKAANKVPKSRDKHKSKLVEDSDSEEDSGIINKDEVPSKSTRNTKAISSRSSSRDIHNTSRSSMKKNKITGDEFPSIEDSSKKKMRIIVSKSETASNKRRKTSQSNDTSSRSTNRQTKLVEDPVSDNPSDNIDYIEMASTSTRSKNAATDPASPSIMLQKEKNIASISRRFSPRKSCYSTPKSPIKRNQLIESENVIIKERENASIGSKHTTLSNMSLQISQISDTGSARHESRLITDQVGVENSSDAKDSGTVSAGDRSKNAPPQNKKSNSQELSKRKSLKKQKRSTSRSSRKKSKLLEVIEVEDDFTDTEGDRTTLIRSSNETVTDKSRQIPHSKNSRSSRNELIEDNTGDSGNELDDIGVDENPSALDEGSTHSPSREAALQEMNKSKSKRKSPAVENDPEDLIHENEVGPSELASGGNAKKSKKKKPNEIPPDQLRRSNREHVCPLAHWLGERRKLKIVKGELVVDGIIPRRWEDNGAKVFVASAVQERYEKSNAVKEKEKKSKLKRLPKTTMLNPHTHELVEVNIHRPFDFIEWSAVGGEKGQKVPYYLTKTFSSEKVTFGFLDICPFQQKTSQYSPEDNIHFVVQKGHVKVVIRKTDFEFQKNDSFIVPCTEAYSIENLGRSNALLAFCTFKVPFFSYQTDLYNE